MRVCLNKKKNLDADFDSQLQGLFQEATQNIEDRDAAARRSEEDKELEITRRVEERMALLVRQGMPAMLRPLVQGLEARSPGRRGKIPWSCKNSTGSAIRR